MKIHVFHSIILLDIFAEDTTLKYNTILFDADGTLLDFKRSEKEAVIHTMQSFGIEATDDKVARYSEINDGLWKALERGEIEKKVLLYRRFELFCEHYSIECDARQMASKYESTLSTKGHIINGADELCNKLYGKLKMYIVTNGVEHIQKGRFSVCPISKYFEKVFVSGVIGYEKPDVRYCDVVSRNIENFKKEDCLIVGDSLTSDIKGGINFGIDTCWYNPNGKEAPKEMDITYIASNFDEIYDIIIGKGEN